MMTIDDACEEESIPQAQNNPEGVKGNFNAKEDFRSVVIQ